MAQSSSKTPQRRYHVHPPLLMYVGVSLLVAVGAFHSQNNLLFWLFGFSLGLMLVSGFISGSMLMGVRLERASIGDAREGEVLEIRYRVRNVGRLLPLMALTIREVSDEDHRGAGPSLWRRLFALRRAINGVGTADGPAAPENGTHHEPSAPGVSERRAKLDAPPLGFLTHVARRGETEIIGRARCVSAGRLRLRHIEVVTSFPFGIMRKSLRFDEPAAALVRLAPAQVEIDLASTGRGAPIAAEETWQQAGNGDEFFALREYVEGDSPRIIAWRRSAAQSKLLVRQTGGAAPGRVWLVMHAPATATPVECLAMTGVTAELVARAGRAGLSIGLIAPQAAIERGARTARVHLIALMDTLALLAMEPAKLRRAAPGAFGPARPLPGDRVIVVHAGAIDHTVGPRGAEHLAARFDDQAVAIADGAAPRSVAMRAVPA
jgi:uncharacterized protein (DUF58 family)